MASASLEVVLCLGADKGHGGSRRSFNDLRWIP